MSRFIFPSLKTLQPVKFRELEGKIIRDIRRLWVGSNEVIFVCSDGIKYMLCPAEDSEDIPRIIRIVGNIGDIIDKPIIWIKDGKDDEIYPNTFRLENKIESLSITFTAGKLEFIRIN